MLPVPEISKEVLKVVSDPTMAATKEYVRKMIKDLKYLPDETASLLKQTMTSIAGILKDGEIHPKIKLQTHKLIMYLILMADPDVYEQFLHYVYGILKVNCMYNKGQPPDIKGEDFFKKSKFFTDPNATPEQKNQIKKIGSSYIIFSLETVYMLAKWLPYDLDDDTKPTKFSIAYESLRREKIEFPKQQNFQFYNNPIVEDMQKVIRDIEKQFESILGSQISGHQTRTVPHSLPLDTQVKKLKSSQGKKQSSILKADVNDMQSKNKIFLLEDEKKKLLKEIEIQRNFFEGQIEKQKKNHQESVLSYEKKILKLEQQVEKQKQKTRDLQTKSQTIQQSEFKVSSQPLQSKKYDKQRDKLVEDLQRSNKQLLQKVKRLEDNIRSMEVENAEIKSKGSQMNVQNSNQSISVMSVEIEKLKKQNKSLKAKILTDCSEASQFSSKKSNTKTRNSEKQPESLKFLGHQDSKSVFEPFYSNSSSQLKVRLRKAILREKELLYRDKILEIGCITKLQNANTVRVTTVFTNISEKPLFNFAIEFVSRQDLVIKLLQNTKNYLQISGQTKSEILVSINQIDFRCLLCSIRFNIEEQIQKTALIMPVSKLKLASQLVYTPIKKHEKLRKIEKVFQIDRKMLPNLHKFKDYFDQAILQVDRTLHEVYNLKIQFMGAKLYVECDQIEGQLRVAVKYSEDEDFSRSEKLLEELTFLLSKN